MRRRQWHAYVTVGGLKAGSTSSRYPSVLSISGSPVWLASLTRRKSGRLRSKPQKQILKTCASELAATRWPDQETVEDLSEGPRLATMQALARYWATDYDWRKCEAKLKALRHFITEIDGLDIHFIHVRSKHENALPLIVTHGWPGSIIEQLKIIDPLTNPTAHGGSAADAFHLVIPSMPGYGYSGKPTKYRLGPGPHRACLGGADEAPWVHPLCGVGRRLGRADHRSDGCTGASGVDRYPHQLPGCCSFRRRSRGPDRRSGAVRSLMTRNHASTRSSRNSLRPTCSTHSRWRPTRRRCTELRIRPSAWPPGCSTTTRRVWR